MTIALTPERIAPVPMITTNEVILGPEDAARWLMEYAYPGQRRLKSANVVLYASEMSAGRFLPLTQLRLGMYEGKLTLLDGQHRLQAVVMSGVPTAFSVVCHDDVTPKQQGSLYGAIDRGGVRTHNDVFQAMGLAERTNLYPTYIKLGGAAMDMILTGFRRSQRHRPLTRVSELRAAMVEYHADNIAAYFNAIDGCSHEWRNQLRVRTLVALGIITFHYQPELAGWFWRDVALRGGHIGDPPHTFMLWCTDKWPKDTHKLLVVRAFSVAWNAAYNDQPLRRFRNLNAMGPVHLDGTAYDGKVVIPPDMAPPEVRHELPVGDLDTRTIA